MKMKSIVAHFLEGPTDRLVSVLFMFDVHVSVIIHIGHLTKDILVNKEMFSASKREHPFGIRRGLPM